MRFQSKVNLFHVLQKAAPIKCFVVTLCTGDEEAAHRRRAQALPTDEVDMASAVKTDSVDKSESEQNEQANPGKEPTLDEAANNIKTGDTNATTSENEGRTAAKERTADNAGSPDGGADL